MRRFGLLLCALFSLSCASAPLSPPYRACLSSRDSRTLFNTGTVVAIRDDGAVLFRYDDPTAGDRGFHWIEETARVKVLCPAAAATQASIYDASAPPRTSP